MAAGIAADLRLRRAAVVTGCAGLIAAAALWVEGPGLPAEGASGEAVRRQVEDGFDSLAWAVTGELVGLAAFLVFLAALNSVLRASEAPGRFWSDLALLSGTLTAVWLAVNVSVAAIPLVLADDDGKLAAYGDGALLALDPIGRLSETMGDVATIPRGLLVLAVSMLVLRTRFVPVWFAYAGFVVAAASVVSIVVTAVGLFGFVLWLPIFSGMVLIRTLRRSRSGA